MKKLFHPRPSLTVIGTIALAVLWGTFAQASTYGDCTDDPNCSDMGTPTTAPAAAPAPPAQSATANALTGNATAAGLNVYKAPSTSSTTIHELDTYNTDLKNCYSELERAQKRAAEWSTYTSDDGKRYYQERQDQVETAKQKCESMKAQKEGREKSLQARRDACNAKNANGTFVEWNEERQACVELNETKSIAYDDCAQADVYRGKDYRGEKCKAAMNAVKNAVAQNSAVGDIASTGMTAGSTYYATQTQNSTNVQKAALENTANMYKMMATVKGVTALSNMYSAYNTYQAGKEAQDSAEKMNKTYDAIRKTCSGLVGSGGAYATEEHCFKSEISKRSAEGIQLDMATLNRLRGGGVESQEQADAAMNVAKSSAITGLADAFTGYQAYQAMKAAQATNLTPPGGPPPPAMIALQPFTNGASVNPIGAATPFTPGSDVGGEGSTLGGAETGRIKGGIMAGANFGSKPFVSAKSGVSAGGGGGARGGGGGGRGGGGRSSRGGGGSGGKKSFGEYNLAGGGAGGGGGGGSGAKKDEKNPFAEALANLFPKDPNGVPVVDPRGLASAQPAAVSEDPSAVTGQGAAVVAAELTIFEQITAKIRERNSIGDI